MNRLRTHWASLVLALGFIGLFGSTRLGGVALAQGTCRPLTPTEQSIARNRCYSGCEVPQDEGVEQSRGVFTFMPSGSLLTVGNGGDCIGSLPQNLVPAQPVVYHAEWTSGGVAVGVVCPRISGESPEHHAGRFANDVAALRQVFPPDITTPSH